MKIALLASAGNIHTRKIANSLAQMGHDVHVFSLVDHMGVEGELAPEIVVRYFKHGGTKSYFYNHWELRRWIREYEIDVLNAHYASGYGTIAALARFHPYALSVWGSDVYLFPNTRLKRRLLEFNLSRADAIFSTSKVMADQTSSFAPGREMAITPFGVDTDLFHPAPIPNTQTRPLRIGIVKTLAPPYGLEYLLRAFALLRGDLPHTAIELHVYGHGPLEGELRDLSEQLQIDDVTTFYGRIPHNTVPAVLRELDVFCVPSLSESFGVAVVEAMSCSVPCVTSDAPGLTEVMVDEVTGFVVARRDERALAAALRALVQDAALRRSMGQAGRDHVLANYRWVENVQHIERTLTSLADPSSSE